MPTRPNTRQILAISLLPALTGVAIPFVHLYLLNAGNLLLPFAVHLPWLTLLTMAVFGLGFTIQQLLPQRIRIFGSLAVLTLGTFTWAESTLLIGDFGFLQGEAIAWEQWRHLLYQRLPFLT